MFTATLRLVLCIIFILFIWLFILAFPPITRRIYKYPPFMGYTLQPESEIHWPVFSYPERYGVEKYALRRALAMTNSSCNFFTKFSANVLQKIETEGTVNTSPLRYFKVQNNNGNDSTSSSSVTFGGNLVNPQERKSYFHYNDRNGQAIPCGFLNSPKTGFAMSGEDREAMESCRGLVVISAIFGDYDKLRQPRYVRQITASKVCFFMFTDNQTFASLAEHQIKPDEFHKIGLWRIVVVTDLPYEDSVMNGVIPKHLPHRLFPNSLYSLWIDAKLQLVVDPLIILDRLLINSNASMAISKHAYNIHTVEEAIFTVRWKKWDREAVRHQMEYYCGEGLQPWSQLKLPYSSDVPDSALILRKLELPTNLFSCLLFNELEVFNPRDQLAFAYIRDMMTPKPVIHMFDVNILNTITTEYRHNRNAKKISKISNKLAMGHSQGSLISLGQRTACQSYLNGMWNSSSVKYSS